MSVLTALFNTRLPIIQAPMAGVQNWELAAAVTSAGGLGSLPCAMLTPEAIETGMQQFRQQTSGPINLNFFTHQQPELDIDTQEKWLKLFQPYYEELNIAVPDSSAGPGRQPFNQSMADLVFRLKPEVVSFHFGLPEPHLLRQVRAAGAKVLSSATTVEEAVWLEQQGVDAIIAQGLEAGGHRGMFLTEDITTQVGTLALLPQIVRAVNIPVIAAGGIVDAAGVKAAIALGASGIQAGTAYLLCDEANTSSIHRSVLQSERAQHTVLTNLFSGRPARGIVNRMIEELGPINTLAPCFPFATFASAPLRTAAEAQGSGDFTPLWAGQNTSGCKAISAADMTMALAKGL